MTVRIVLDWDGVVFDDDKFKTDLLATLSKHSELSIEIISELYQSSKDLNGYNDLRLAEAIATKTGRHDAEALHKVITSILEDDGPSYIFPSSQDFLRAVSTRYPVTVLTAGDERIQGHKIAHSGVKSYLDDVVVTPVNKTELNKQYELEKILTTNESVLFFDDKISTILHLHEILRDIPSILPIWINSQLEDSASNGIVARSLNANDMSLYESILGERRTLIAAAYISSAGKIVMVQENKGRAKDLWTIPIGHVDPDETFLESIIREVSEETDLKAHAKDFRSLLMVEGIDYLGGEQDIGSKVIIACFDMVTSSDVSQMSSKSELKWQWVPSEELASLPLRGHWQHTLTRP